MVVEKWQIPTDRIRITGREPLIQRERRVEVATDFYAGRLAATGTTEYDVTVASALKRPVGWIDYEGTPYRYKPSTVSTIYAADDVANIVSGGDFVILGSVAKGCNMADGDLVANWTGGQVIGPVLPADGGVYLGIPFAKSATECSTNIELPADLLVGTPFVDVATAASGASIDVGLNEAVDGGETGGDANGFLDGVSCAAAKKVAPIKVNATAANITLGALLGTQIKSADSTALYAAIENWHRCDGTAKTVTYTTSDHTVAGRIWLPLISEGIGIVGQVQENVNTTSAAASAFVLSLI